MAVAFARTNQFQIPGGPLIVSGTLTVTSAPTAFVPADAGVKKFIAVLGATFNADDELFIPTLTSDGQGMTVAPIVAADGLAQEVELTWPVGVYSYLSFLAV